jgi:hypothetical protein
MSIEIILPNPWFPRVINVNRYATNNLNAIQKGDGSVAPNFSIEHMMPHVPGSACSKRQKYRLTVASFPEPIHFSHEHIFPRII